MTERHRPTAPVAGCRLFDRPGHASACAPVAGRAIDPARHRHGGRAVDGDWPNRPVRIVVPFGPGGSPDIFTRMAARELEKRIGQPVLVENRAGANGIVGTSYVAKMPPDGYTILYGSNSGLSAAHALFKNPGYDPINDFPASR